GCDAVFGLHAKSDDSADKQAYSKQHRGGSGQILCMNKCDHISRRKGNIAKVNSSEERKNTYEQAETAAGRFFVIKTSRAFRIVFFFWQWSVILFYIQQCFVIFPHFFLAFLTYMFRRNVGVDGSSWFLVRNRLFQCFRNRLFVGG